MSFSTIILAGKAVARKIIRPLGVISSGLEPHPAGGILFTAADIQALGRKPVLPKQDRLRFHNPSRQMQELFVGGSFIGAYIEASNFLNYLFTTIYPGTSARDMDGMKILDFGCGWGRMLRLIASKAELHGAELHGCDPVAEALDACRRSLPDVWLIPADWLPPTAYRSELFDLIYAYSVFSHLSPASHLAWAEELARILKPGGHVCLTTQARRFIGICRQFGEGKRAMTSPWHQSLARSFAEPDCEARFDAGEFLYSATGGPGGSDLYGEAIVPREFFEENWSRFGLGVIDWQVPQADFAQTRVVLRKQPKTGGK